MKLTDRAIKAAKPKDKPYKMADGKGMYLQVMPHGSKLWRLKYRYQGKENSLSLGSYPETTLAEAREMRDSCRKTLKQGKDPSFARKEEKLNAALRAEHNFEAVAREWHAHNKPRWTDRHADNVIHRLEKDMFPRIGTRPVSEITSLEVLEAVRKIESRGAHEVAKRTLAIAGQVFTFAIGTGRAQNNPAAGMNSILKPAPKGHYAALDAKDLPEFVTKLEKNDARLYAHTRRAMKLLMLTFVRTSELINATWDEFDLENAEWIIPAERMKMRQAHIVPLSKQAVAILKEQQEETGKWEFVFPNQVRPKKAMSNNTILKALERMGYKGRMTGHGFRALAMSTIKEKLGYRHEVVDRQLAHAPKNRIDAAYDRAKFLDERKVMMQRWADYIDAMTSQGKVVHGKFGKAA